ncbi:hypothetical protein NVV94_05310 [Pseudomonas sp. LS1212]|uniref:hypothetical protein n=1 Tax=Pseudomonas sp. LS1212 TaxID=2972478 RepID=UPI00215C0F31|nr:hypothetical protein [Pseudomonas sp. LS1212]UVJ45002.1 hypothetical protein NVV94_05310 [Pseudomonas sp. LS1212]
MTILYSNKANGDLGEAFGELEALFHAMTQIVPVSHRKPRRAMTVHLNYKADGALDSILALPTHAGEDV